MEIDWKSDESVVTARHPDAKVDLSFDCGKTRYQIVCRSIPGGRLSVPYTTRAMAWATARIATTVYQFEIESKRRMAA